MSISETITVAISSESPSTSLDIVFNSYSTHHLNLNTATMSLRVARHSAGSQQRDHGSNLRLAAANVSYRIRRRHRGIPAQSRNHRTPRKHFKPTPEGVKAGKEIFLERSRPETHISHLGDAGHPLLPVVETVKQPTCENFCSQCCPGSVPRNKRPRAEQPDSTSEEQPKRRKAAEPRKEDAAALSCAEGSDGGSPVAIPTPSPCSTFPKEGARLACPYAKHDPLRYPRCLATPLASPADVKRHIRRVHQRPEFCARCFKEFTGPGCSKARLDHIVARECELRPGPITVEGLHDDLMDMLREWEPVPTRSVRQQWEEIWTIVFPGRAVPDTPFLDEQEGI